MSEMESMVALLKVRVIRGKNLAIRDWKHSDPYVIVKLGNQTVKTRVIKKNLNPVWDEELTLLIPKTLARLTLRVYDKDTFTRDDKMGDANVDLQPLATCAQSLNLSKNTYSGAIISTVEPSEQNCLSRASHIKYIEGCVVQNLCLKLMNTESGELEIALKWINLKK